MGLTLSLFASVLLLFQMLPCNQKLTFHATRLIALAIAVAVVGRDANAETWTNLEGTGTIDAQMIGLWEDSVILQQSDGRRRTIKLEKLRADSRIQAFNLAKQQAAARAERIKQLKQQSADSQAAAPAKLPEPPPAPPYNPPEKDASIGDFVQQVNDAMKAGHLRVLYDFRPPSYRKDISDLIKLAANKTSPETFQVLTNIPFRFGDVIMSHQNWLFASPRFANIPEAERDKAKWMLLGLASLFQQGMSPEAIQLKTLQTDEFETWLDSWDKTVAPYVAEMIKKTEIDLSGNTTVVSEGEGSATISTGSGDSRADVEMVPVEGYWVPKATADTWTSEVELAKKRITETPDGKFFADQAVLAGIFGAAFDSLAKADSAEQFNQSLDTVLSQPDSATTFGQTIESMLSPIQTIMAGASPSTNTETDTDDGDQ